MLPTDSKKGFHPGCFVFWLRTENKGHGMPITAISWAVVILKWPLQFFQYLLRPQHWNHALAKTIIWWFWNCYICMDLASDALGTFMKLTPLILHTWFNDMVWYSAFKSTSFWQGLDCQKVYGWCTRLGKEASKNAGLNRLQYSNTTSQCGL